MRADLMMATLALFFVLSGFNSPVIRHQFAITSLLNQGTPDTHPPKVNTEFQGEVARLAAEGLRLKEAIGADLDAANHHLAAIFERARTNASGAAFEFRIIESDGKTSKTIFTRKEFFFSFAALNETAKLNATDINGDGLKEIFVQSSSGGNCWACNPIEIYQVNNHAVKLLAAAPIQKISDLNGDGLAELVIADARWEGYGDLSRAAAPSAKLVYAWKNGRYVNASRDYANFYQVEIERLRSALNEAKASITATEGSDDFYIGLAITLVISYRQAGEIERGLKEFEVLMNANTHSQEQLKRRATIIRDFSLGDSADKLLQIKYGDPLLE